MRSHILVCAAFAGLFSCLPPVTAGAQQVGGSSDDKQRISQVHRGSRSSEAGDRYSKSRLGSSRFPLVVATDRQQLTTPGTGMLDNQEDPENQLRQIRERSAERDSMLPVSPLVGVHDMTKRWKESLSEGYDVEVGAAFNHLFQFYSDAVTGEDTWGTATTMLLSASWGLVNRDSPTQGQVFLGIEGRWDYGTTGPMNLGAPSLGTMIFTANTYAEYVPAFLPIRNLYWQQGSKQAGWLYRAGKITPDQLMATSKHLSPSTTFNTIAGTGPFANALPDSGLGVAGAWYFTDRVGLIGVIGDANGNRQNWGDVGAGDFYKAIELGAQIAPRTDDAGYSKLTLWHTDGTKDGQPINAMTGLPGWGFYLKFEQELTADGRQVLLANYGRSYGDSALYKQQAGVHWVLYDPHFFRRIANDALGAAVNWIEATQQGTRDEYNLEVFYRFPLFPLVDTTLNYQWLYHPALNIGIDQASAFGIRIRTTF